MGDFVRKGNVSNAVPVHIRMKYIRPLLWVIKSIISIIITFRINKNNMANQRRIGLFLAKKDRMLMIKKCQK